MNQDWVPLTLMVVGIALAGWGLTQVIIGLVRPESSILDQRLREGLRQQQAAVGGHVALLRQAPNLPALFANIEPLRHFANRLRLVFPSLSLVGFLAITLGLASVAFALLTVFHSLLAGIFGAIIGAVIPLLVFNVRRARRQRILADQLMDALEFLARALRAGHSLSTGIQMVAEELPEPVATEFRRCHDQHSLGRSIEEALLEMADRADSTDFAFFVTSVIIQRQTGGDLAALLDNLGGLVRNRIRLRQHVRALTGEGRFTSYLLAALPPLMFMALYILKPDYMRYLIDTSIGRTLILVMVVLQIVGFLLMRRIVNVRV